MAIRSLATFNGTPQACNSRQRAFVHLIRTTYLIENLLTSSLSFRFLLTASFQNLYDTSTNPASSITRLANHSQGLALLQLSPFRYHFISSFHSELSLLQNSEVIPAQTSAYLEVSQLSPARDCSPLHSSSPKFTEKNKMDFVVFLPAYKTTTDASSNYRALLLVMLAPASLVQS